MARLDRWLTYLRKQGGSDLHLAAGLEPRLRLHGDLRAIPEQAALSDEALRSLLVELPTSAQWEAYEKSGDLDFAYGIEGVGRFRANYFRQDRGAGAVFRLIPEKIVPLSALSLPRSIEGLAHIGKGLALVTGPTGSGKSTTLAAILDCINENYSRHVVTIEDPIEFVHQNKKSVFSHREVGSHTNGFGPALRAAIREDADVILVGEMRDCETISLALTAAEMGMLVFGTLHTNGAAKTIDRIVDAFPADQQPRARLSLSESLAAVVSQVLIPTADGKGRCAALEVLLRTPGLPNVIREGNTSMLNSIIQSGRAQGMQTMDAALAALVAEGRIRTDEAYLRASDKSKFGSAAA
jgi:twitching motility protein PilT